MWNKIKIYRNNVKFLNEKKNQYIRINEHINEI